MKVSLTNVVLLSVLIESALEVTDFGMVNIYLDKEAIPIEGDDPQYTDYAGVCEMVCQMKCAKFPGAQACNYYVAESLCRIMSDAYGNTINVTSKYNVNAFVKGVLLFAFY